MHSQFYTYNFQLYVQTLESKPWVQCSSIESNLSLISTILVCNSLVKRKSFSSVEIMSKHVYGNIQMPCQSFCNLDFIKHNVKNILSSSTLPMPWTMASLTSLMNSKKWTTNKLFVVSWRHNFSQWIFISRFYHGLKGLILHGQLEKKTL